MRLLRATALAFAAVMTVASTSCHHAPGGTVLAVTISPTAVTLPVGEMGTFTANVVAVGAVDTSVEWSASCGSVTGGGHTVTYTAPATPGTCTLTATSNADPTESADATITVTAPSTINVTITPTHATLRIGRTQTFTAAVTGTPNTAVAWATTGGTCQTTADTATYTAPNVLGDYVLTATSVADPSQSASAAIRVVAHPDEVWARQFGSTDYDTAEGVAVDAEGNAYVAGHTDGDLFGATVGWVDAFLVKYDADGNERWSRKVGGGSMDVAFWGDVAVGPAGHVVVVGSTNGSLAGPGSNHGGRDVIVAKYAPDGTRQWLVQLGSSESDVGIGVAIDVDGNVFVAGETMGQLGQKHWGTWDAFLMKLDENGVHQWTYQFGTGNRDGAYGVAVGSAGNVVATGGTGGSLTAAPNQGSDDVFVVKLDTNGGVTWLRQFGSDDHDFGHGVAIDPFGDVIVVGETAGSLPGPGLSHGGTDAFVARLTADGAPRWADQYGTPGDDVFRAVAVGLAGNVVAAGTTTGAYAEPNPAGDDHGLVVKLDAERRQLWARQLGAWPTGTTWFNDVAIGPAGNVLAVGRTDGDLAGAHLGQAADALVVKLAP